ncbi:MAG: hypothetical protein ACPIOQ_57690, partial [Promethearchaeia archaeon]
VVSFLLWCNVQPELVLAGEHVRGLACELGLYVCVRVFAGHCNRDEMTTADPASRIHKTCVCMLRV